jgi:hypothetical protein
MFMLWKNPFGIKSKKKKKKVNEKERVEPNKLKTSFDPFKKLPVMWINSWNCRGAVKLVEFI